MCVLARLQRREFPGQIFLTSVLALLLLSLPAWAAEKARFHVNDYQIDAVLNPHDHKITARAKVKVTALEEMNVAVFNLHNDLRLTKVADESGKVLTTDRTPQDSSVRVSLNNTVAKGDSTTLTFEYEGVITGNEDGPVEGLRLAAIQEPITYLLYGARWFPTTGYMTDRFTAEMIPTTSAIETEKKSAASPSSTVAGRRSHTASRTLSAVFPNSNPAIGDTTRRGRRRRDGRNIER